MLDQKSEDILSHAAKLGNIITIEFHDGSHVTSKISGLGNKVEIRDNGTLIPLNYYLIKGDRVGRVFSESDVKRATGHNIWTLN